MASKPSINESIYQWHLNLTYGSSVYWNVFLMPFEQGKCIINVLGYCKCACCGALIKLNGDLSTSNLKRHWEDNHKAVTIPGMLGTSIEGN